MGTSGRRTRTLRLDRKVFDQFFGAGPPHAKFDGPDSQHVAFAYARFGDRMAVEPGAPIQRLDDNLRAVAHKQRVPRIDPLFGQSNRALDTAADRQSRLVEQNRRFVKARARRFQNQEPCIPGVDAVPHVLEDGLQCIE